ncbi:MAG: DUF4349 domain-containing protein [Bacteroidetes bacterium]|nr:DUF4349 domain-containing protein [Bacteroidota bacterium]
MKKQLIPAIFALLMLLSCGGANDYSSSTPMSGLSFQDAGENTKDLPEPKIIKEGYLTLETHNIELTSAFVKQQTEALGGSISSEGAYDESTRTSRNMVIRVPADNFDTLIRALEQHAKRVVNKNISQRDVGEEYVDVEARLATKKELETRYRELLKQARTVEEMLSIERELANVRAEIESMTGRLRYLNDKVAMSTLNLDFYQTHSPASQFVARLVNSAVNGWYAFLGLLVWFAGLWPFVLLAIVLVGIYRLRKRGRKGDTN